MTEQSEMAASRSVRPWIAALLTFLGWGVGFYYAGQSGTAWRWAWFQILFGVALGAAVLGSMLVTGKVLIPFYNPGSFGSLDLIAIAGSVFVAVFAWIATARRSRVDHGGRVRLFGYLAIWLVPLLLSASLAFGVRSFAIQPFRIPSSGMEPTVAAGDYAIANKHIYGYSRFSFAPIEGLLPAGRWQAGEPMRGDIVVFRPERRPGRDFLKRLVGMPGDRIQMIAGVLHINDVPVLLETLGEVEHRGLVVLAVRETLPNGVSYVTYDQGETERDNTPAFTVPEGHYFMLGDNRDNSMDSRAQAEVGFVPYDHLLGRVDKVIKGEAE